MELKTYDGILTEMCDNFDALISPKRISRVNSNIIYLIFKAIAKGYEVINNVCVALSSKFDPEFCSDEDLISVASIVGTKIRGGTASGLHVFVTNTSLVEQTLLTGTYTYNLDDDTVFEFMVFEDKVLQNEEQVDFIAMSTRIGRFNVTQQSNIAVNSTAEIPEDIVFSCTNNTSLLGAEPETNIEFRNRINTDTTRQNSLIELQDNIKSLPYVFDCKVKFNETESDITYDDYTIPPFSALIFISGELKPEIAEKVAEKIIFPTVQTDTSTRLVYRNDVFSTGEYEVYVTPFKKTPYSINIEYRVDETLVNIYDIKEKITKALNANLVAERHIDFIKEDMIYNIVNSLDLTGVDILGVDLIYNETKVNYISVPVSRIPELVGVTFNN